MDVGRESLMGLRFPGEEQDELASLRAQLEEKERELKQAREELTQALRAAAINAQTAVELREEIEREGEKARSVIEELVQRNDKYRENERRLIEEIKRMQAVVEAVEAGNATVYAWESRKPDGHYAMMQLVPDGNNGSHPLLPNETRVYIPGRDGHVRSYPSVVCSRCFSSEGVINLTIPRSVYEQTYKNTREGEQDARSEGR